MICEICKIRKGVVYFGKTLFCAVCGLAYSKNNYSCKLIVSLTGYSHKG